MRGKRHLEFKIEAAKQVVDIKWLMSLTGLVSQSKAFMLGLSVTAGQAMMYENQYFEDLEIV